MKKALAYVTTAVLLGFAVMMLPLALQSPLSPINPQDRYTPAEDATKSAEYSVLQLYGIARQPANLFPSSLVFFSGLIIALAMYFLLKKRMS